MSEKDPAKKLGLVLDALMTEQEIDGIRLSAYSGVPVTTINRLRTGHPSNNPTISSLVPLAAYFNISVGQLMGDKVIENVKQDAKNTVLPLLAWDECLHWPKIQRANLSFIHSDNKYSKQAFALLAEDDWEHWHQGMAVLVDPAVTPAHRDYVIVHHQSQAQATIKQFIQDDMQTYLKPIFPGFNTIPFTSEHKIIGVVMEYKKTLKPIS